MLLREALPPQSAVKESRYRAIRDKQCCGTQVLQQQRKALSAPLSALRAHVERQRTSLPGGQPAANWPFCDLELRARGLGPVAFRYGSRRSVGLCCWYAPAVAMRIRSLACAPVADVAIVLPPPPGKPIRRQGSMYMAGLTAFACFMASFQGSYRRLTGQRPNPSECARAGIPFTGPS